MILYSRRLGLVHRASQTHYVNTFHHYKYLDYSDSSLLYTAAYTSLGTDDIIHIHSNIHILVVRYKIKIKVYFVDRYPDSLSVHWDLKSPNS